MRRSVALFASLVAAMLAALPARAADADARAIVVSGVGEVMAKPDQARLTAGVVTDGTTATAALSANTTAMNRVFAALKAAGIPDTKIQTSNFSVNPQYPPYRVDSPEPRTITGYQVSNQVTVVIDDLSKVGSVIDALVKSGANQSYGLGFGIADPKPYESKARAAAVADAAAKAKTLAEAAGVRLGAVMSIQEGGVALPAPRFMALAAAAVSPGPPPVAAGEETVRVNVTMTYAIQ
jgi:uncharacterized protein YggE